MGESIFGIAAEAAKAKGEQRRDALKQRTQSVTEKVNAAINFVGGIDDAAKLVGQRAIEVGIQTGREAVKSVVDTSKRAYDSATGAAERGWDRAKGFAEKCWKGVTDTKDKAIAKAIDTGDRAKKWGVENIAKPVVDRLDKAAELPAKFNEWRAAGAEAKAEKYVLKAKAEKQDLAAERARLQAEWNDFKAKSEARMAKLSEAGGEAMIRSAQLKEAGQARRDQKNNVFSRIRGMLAGL